MEVIAYEPMIWNVDTTSFAYKFMMVSDGFYGLCLILLVVAIILAFLEAIECVSNDNRMLSSKVYKGVLCVFIMASLALLFGPSKETMVFRYVSKVINDNNITNMSHIMVRGILEEHRILDTRRALELVAPHRINVRKEDDNSVIIKEASKDLHW